MRMKHLLLLLFLLLSGCDKFSFSYHSGPSNVQLKIQQDLDELQYRLNLLQQQLLTGVNVPDKFYPSGLTSLANVLDSSNKLSKDLKSIKSKDGVVFQSGLNKYVSNITTNKRFLAGKAQVVKDLSINIQNLTYTIPGLSAATDKLADTEVKRGASPATIYIITRQLMLLQRMRANADQFLHPDINKPDSPVTAADRLGRDTQLLLSVYSSFKSGNKKYRIPRLRGKVAQAELDGILKFAPGLKKTVVTILDISPEYFQYNSALLSLSDTCNRLSKVVFNLQQVILSGNNSGHLL